MGKIEGWDPQIFVCEKKTLDKGRNHVRSDSI